MVTQIINISVMERIPPSDEEWLIAYLPSQEDGYAALFLPDS